MRSNFSQALQSIGQRNPSTEILTTETNSQQQVFFQVISLIKLIKDHERESSPDSAENQQKSECLCKLKQIHQIPDLLTRYQGAYSSLILRFKYLALKTSAKSMVSVEFFPVLKLLDKWTDTFKSLRKNNGPINLWKSIVEVINSHKGSISPEEFIIFMNYISKNIITLLEDQQQGVKKSMNELSSNEIDSSGISTNSYDSADLICFLRSILPKVLWNIMVPRKHFPSSLLDTRAEELDLLYANQNIENTVSLCSNYMKLICKLLLILLQCPLDSSSLRQLALAAFKLYYLGHEQTEKWEAHSIVIQALAKLDKTARFAMYEDINIFMVILKKLGHFSFMQRLVSEFEWMQQINEVRTSIVNYLQPEGPSFSKVINSVKQFQVQAGSIERRYIEIHDRFSLVYFSVKCIEHNINIKFVYLGDFNQVAPQCPKVIFSQEKENLHQGSLTALSIGIYMFELDNSYSWVKSKTIAYDITVLVPLQLHEHQSHSLHSRIKSAYYQCQRLNQLPIDSILGWIGENQENIYSAVLNVCRKLKKDRVIYSLKLTRNIGKTYQYETNNQQDFLQKCQELQKETGLVCKIEGYKSKAFLQDLPKYLQQQIDLRQENELMYTYKNNGRFRTTETSSQSGETGFKKEETGLEQAGPEETEQDMTV